MLGYSGPGHVIFTSRAAVGSGCYAENLGKIYNPESVYLMIYVIFILG
jgi:hypothetical protein